MLDGSDVTIQVGEGWREELASKAELEEVRVEGGEDTGFVGPGEKIRYDANT